MTLTTEIFVLAVFLLALPVLFFLFKSTQFPGAHCFLTAFIFLLCSNIFTVIEMWIYPGLCNLLEHLSITLSSVFFFIALRVFINARLKSLEHTPGNPSR
jgi:hypothetical protein